MSTDTMTRQERHEAELRHALARGLQIHCTQGTHTGYRVALAVDTLPCPCDYDETEAEFRRFVQTALTSSEPYAVAAAAQRYVSAIVSAAADSLTRAEEAGETVTYGVPR